MRKIVCLMTAAVVVVAGCSTPDRKPDEPLTIDGNDVILRINDRDVRVSGADLSTTGLSAASQTPLGKPTPVTVGGGKARWTYPDRGLSVSVSMHDGRARFEFTSDRDQTLQWPVTGVGAKDLQLANGEGQNLPTDDPFWNDPAAGLIGGDDLRLQDFTLPIWGYSAGQSGASYLVPTDIGTSMKFSAGLSAVTSHVFSRDRGTSSYVVEMTTTDGNPIAPARDYRQYLDSTGAPESLQNKAKRDPDVVKLRGAFHAYTWGAARKPEFIAALRKLGISAMWLGYDSDDAPMSAEAVTAAKEAGYLVGPYDSVSNAQDPSGPVDAPTSQWPGTTYPDACVVTATGERQGGFGGRGCYVSSAALAQHPELLQQRQSSLMANGVNSYFLDVDATGELFDDYSPQHSMTQAQDREHRLDRMRDLSRRTVLGSEAAASWAADVLDFSHGSSTPVWPALWKAEKDRATWGAYYGPDGPVFFTKPVTLDKNLATSMFDPKYRIPLYEVALHDVLVSTDRWELPITKFPDLSSTRTLLAMLNGTPLNYILNSTNLAQIGPSMADAQSFFAASQAVSGSEVMTNFEWLTPDRLVQRTTFGGGALVMTANFSKADADGTKAGCVRAVGAGLDRQLCPQG